MLKYRCETCGSKVVKLVALDACGNFRHAWCSEWCRKVSNYYNDGCQHPAGRRVNRKSLAKLKRGRVV